MSERYLVTGVDLAMLITELEKNKRQKIVDEIIDKQFIGNSDTNIVDDASSVANWWSKEPTYKNYVTPKLQEQFVRDCFENCLDFYSCGCILTAHLVLQTLMQHTYKGVWKQKKVTPKEAWEDAMRETNYHSGASASMTAIMIARYSPRGDEFREWCKKDNPVMVKW